MRFALAAIVAGALDLAVLLKIDQWIGVGALLAIAYLLLASAGAGFFAGRRAPFPTAVRRCNGASGRYSNNMPTVCLPGDS